MASSGDKDALLLQHYKEVLIQAYNQKMSDKLEEVRKLEDVSELSSLRSLMLDPKNPIMWNALALVFLTLERLEEAEDAIKESLDIDTSNPWTWRLWGDILIRIGRLREAELALRMSHELHPDNSDTLYELLLLQLARGAINQAMDTLTLLMVNSPNNQTLWDCYTKCFSESKQERLLDSCLAKKGTETQT